MPIVGGDINSDFGRRRDEDGILSDGHEAGGTRSLRHEAREAQWKGVPQFCKNNHLRVVTTDRDIGDTYYGKEGEIRATHASK